MIENRRLNQYIRRDLVNNALGKAFKETREEFIKRVAELADDVYQDQLGDYLETMKKLPKGFFNESQYINAEFNGARVSLPFNGNGGVTYQIVLVGAPSAVERITPYHYQYGGGARYAPDTRLATKWELLANDWASHAESESQIEGEVYALVHSVSSVKKLLEVWPEAVEILPKHLSPPPTNLPTVVIEDLNARIGLPSEKLNSAAAE